MHDQQQAHYALEEAAHFRLITQTPFVKWEATDRLIPKHEAILLPPVQPSKIIAIGLNYRSHAHEMNMALPEEPLLFLKPLSSLAASGDVISLPKASSQVDYEGELTIVINKQCKSVPLDEVDNVIAGYTLANDITARDLQKRDGQWARAKGFDGFCPIGPCLVTDVDWQTLNFKTYLNNELKQTGQVEDFIFNIPTIVSFVSNVMTLHPGDIILTGTPPGIGEIKIGDHIEIKNDQIGTLINTVK